LAIGQRFEKKKFVLQPINRLEKLVRQKTDECNISLRINIGCLPFSNIKGQYKYDSVFVTYGMRR